MLLSKLLTVVPNAAVASFVASNSNGVSGNSVVIDKPIGTVDGDLMVVMLYNGYGSDVNCTWTPPSGWTEASDQGVSPDLCIMYKVASSEGSNYTFNANTGFVSVGILSTFRGVSTLTRITATSNTLSTPTLSNPSSKLAVAAFALKGVLSGAAPSGATLASYRDGVYADGVMAYKINPPSSVAYTLTGTGTAASIAMAFD